MNTTTLRDLEARLVAATGPNYWLECLIALHTGYWPADRIKKVMEGNILFTDGPELPPVPNVTASLDAAVALFDRLLPEDILHASFGGHPMAPGERRPMATVWWHTGELSHFKGATFPESKPFSVDSAPNRAIAICLATIRALLAKETPND